MKIAMVMLGLIGLYLVLAHSGAAAQVWGTFANSVTQETNQLQNA